MIHPLLLESATGLAAKIRAREASSREVVAVHIERIRAVNPVINALVRDRFDAALAEADAADRAVAAGGSDLGPLHGVPCTIKECFRLAGMPNSAGLVARKDVVADGDATAVARLRAAGAIPLGVTNLSELCMWMETNNRVYGRTNNPYDPTRIVGGSSGGEGAVVGAGGSPFGLGSDIGGSIRMPAFFNGVFGHKPSGGLVPGSGQFPLAHGPALRYLTTGPLARRAEDLPLLLRVLAGPDGEDSACEPLALGDPAAVDLAALQVLDVQWDGRNRVSDDLAEGQRRAAAHLASRGARVERVVLEGAERTFEIWSAMMGAAGGPSFAEHLGAGTRARGLRLLPGWMIRRTPHTLPAILLALLESAAARLPGRDRALAEGRALKLRLEELAGPRTVILYPSYPRPAPRHYAPLFRPFEFAYTAIFNVMEMPSTQVPLGLNSEGLPLGVQVAARRGGDAATLAVALELERAFGGWTPPPDLG